MWTSLFQLRVMQEEQNRSKQSLTFSLKKTNIWITNLILYSKPYIFFDFMLNVTI